jgi:hypothetical protein
VREVEVARTSRADGVGSQILVGFLGAAQVEGVGSAHDLVDVATLERRADGGDWRAAWRLAELLVERDEIVALERRADGGDRQAAWRLAALLVEHGDLARLDRRADAGDEHAAEQLARLQTRRR